MYLRDRCCVALPPDLDKGIEPCGLCGHDGRGRAAHVPCKGKGIPRVRGVGVGVGDGERKRKQVCQRGREERREKREKREKREEREEREEKREEKRLLCWLMVCASLNCRTVPMLARRAWWHMIGA